METNVRHDLKIVDVWLTREEARDAAIQEKLKPLYQEYKAKKYLVVEFISGSEDLWENTSALLSYNRKLSARLEVEREKQQGMTMEMGQA